LALIEADYMQDSCGRGCFQRGDKVPGARRGVVAAILGSGRRAKTQLEAVTAVRE
jgi:hypothetical protein